MKKSLAAAKPKLSWVPASLETEAKYRLIYFNVTGLAEPIRYLFAYGKIPYEDCRLEYNEWLTYKTRTPFGQIPVLEIDGKLYNQTTALCRYFANGLGLMGKTQLEALQSDMIVDSITDFRLNYAAYFKQETEEDKEMKLKEIKEIHNPFYLTRFEKIAEENGGHFVNNKLTLADIFFAALADLWLKVVKEPILKDYPTLHALKIKVDNEPNIKIYRDKRPETLY